MCLTCADVAVLAAVAAVPWYRVFWARVWKVKGGRGI